MESRVFSFSLGKKGLLMLALSFALTGSVQLMAQPDNSDLTRRLSRYLSGTNVPQARTELPYWVKAEYVLGSLGISTAPVAPASFGRVAGALGISNADAATLIGAYQSALKSSEAAEGSTLQQMRSICARHMTNGKVVDPYALAVDVQEFENEQREAKNTRYRALISSQSPATVAALDKRLNDQNIYSHVSHSAIDYVGLAQEFPDVIAQQFEALCNADPSDRLEATISNSNGARNGLFRK